jgi:LDH2 family malate/lactate/ureidoglycolate dehydrogenase
MLKPDAFAEHDHFAGYMSQWIDSYIAAGGEHARLPGRRGSALEQEACAHGIVLAPATEQELKELGIRRGVRFPDTL